MAEALQSAGLNWLQRASLYLGLKAASAAGYFGGRSFSLTDHDALRGWGNATYTGKAVSDKSAMQISTVWACVRILAESIGQLPWSVYRKESNGDLTKVDHPLTDVLMDRPNADMSSVEYREAFMTNLGLRGNAPSLIERGSTRIESLYPLNANNVTWKRVDSGDLQYSVLDRGKWEKYPAEKIWHLRIFSQDGVTGLSPIGYAAEAMGFSLGLEEFGARLFGQGMHAGSVIEYPSWIPDDKRKLAQEKLKRLYQGLLHTGEPFLLEGGMKLARGILPPAEAQFLELRGFEVDDICRFYLMPPHRVARLDRATNNNIEQLSLEFVTYTLLPYLVKIERSAGYVLFAPRDRGKYVVRFNYDGYLRADSAGRAALEATWLQNGVLTRNQVRSLENQPLSDAAGMDDYTVQSNMIKTTDLDAVAEAMRARLLTGRRAGDAQPPVPAKAFEPPAMKEAASQINIHPPNVNVAAPEVTVHNEAPGAAAAAPQQAYQLDGELEFIDVLLGELRGVDRSASERSEESRARVKQFEEGLAKLAKLNSMPRKAVYNAQGELIGAHLAETLD